MRAVELSRFLTQGLRRRLVLFGLVAALSPAHAFADVLVIAAHPDDDAIMASGVIYRALQRGEAVRVVIVTNGDYNGLSEGQIRQGEAINAEGQLGVIENNVVLLGYPDGYLNTIRDSYTTTGVAFRAPTTGRTTTYASRGLGHLDYHTYRYGVAGPYNWPTMVGDLADFISIFRPTHIFTHSQFDSHTDHLSVGYLAVEAVQQAITANPGYNPTIHKTLVWVGDPNAGNESWPLPPSPTTYFTEFPHYDPANPLLWTERESLDVPLAAQSAYYAENPKYNAVSAHVSQGGVDRYIGKFIHKDEFFWTEQAAGTNRPPVPNAGSDQQVNEGVIVTLDGSTSWDRNGDSVRYQWRQVAGPTVALSSPTVARPSFTAPAGLPQDTNLAFELTVSDGVLTSFPDSVLVRVRSAATPLYGQNVAPSATFSASSARTGNGPEKVADGIAAGYPTDPSREWVTAYEGAGAWIQMNWSTAVTIGKIVLHDRPNSSDQVTAGSVQFSDGSSLNTGPLNDDGTAVSYTFPPKTITWLRFTVQQVSADTANIGLSEFEVYPLAGNVAPNANAGSDQTVSGSSVVTLDGRASSDPNQDPITFSWSQVAGPSVVLSNPFSSTPSFTAPAAISSAQTLTFRLVVSDGTLSSAPDTANVTVLSNINLAPTANAGPDQQVSAGASVTLDGTGSGDPEGQALSYTWTQTAGTAVPLAGATTARPTFTLPSLAVSEVLTFQLVVGDGVNVSSPDIVNITVVALPPGPINIAGSASVTASSERAPNQAAVKAIDGVVSGYPADSSREWSTVGERVGAWIELRWPTSRTISGARLHDRPNTDDQILSGTLTFSDGSSVPVGILPNDGTGLDVTFSSRSVTWLRFTVNSVKSSTYEVGLAEILVFQASGPSQPSLSVGDTSVTEGDAGTTTLTFTVTLSAASTQTVTVNYATSDGTALTGQDYTATSGTLTFPPGTMVQNVSVPVLGDRVPEATETFGLTLSGASNATIADGTGVATILDNDPLPALSIGSASVVESDTGTVTATFAVTLSGATSQTVTVQYATGNGTALAPQDYTGVSGTLTFSPGVTSQVINVPVLGDLLSEATETFVVTLTAATNATIATPQGTGTITDNDPLPALSVSDVTVTEGNSGSANATFAVGLSALSGQVVTVNYASADATATSGQDYTATSGTVTFAPGTTSQSIAVPVVGDLVPEATETFMITLTGAANATIARPQAMGTILDNDPLPALSIDDVSVTEGNVGTTNALFTVSLSAPSTQAITVAYGMANGTALTPGDYTAAAGTLTFDPGVTSQAINVPVVGDSLNEANETFTVNLTLPTNAVIVKSQATGTILNDDAPPSLSINDVTVAEGNTGSVNATFTVTLTAASEQSITVNYATSDGTAVAGQDYTTRSGTLTFAAGTTSQTVAVPVVGDALNEVNETFTVNLSSPVNATVLLGRGMGTILDDDPSPSLSIGDVTTTEGNTGSVNATFTVTLSTASGQVVTVGFTTANGTAVSGQDYTATTGMLTFAAGATSQTISVPVLGDLVYEPTETFVANLSGPTNASIARAQATGTIVDNDPQPSVSIADATASEGDTGTVNATFAVTLSAASTQVVTVTYATTGGTALLGQDFAATSGTLTFAPGTTALAVNVPIIGDLVAESTETFLVNLSGPINATITRAQATGTIVDNDSPINVAQSASVTASSERAPNQAAIKAIDGVVSGYPVDATREWATVVQRAGAWIELRWISAQTVNGVRLHDRPNTDDQVLSGTLTFSDGSSVAVGTLPNNGAGLDVAFASRTVTWVRFTVNSVKASTYNIGLAEILVFQAPQP